VLLRTIIGEYQLSEEQMRQLLEYARKKFGRTKDDGEHRR
jgi:hypothetical protein